MNDDSTVKDNDKRRSLNPRHAPFGKRPFYMGDLIERSILNGFSYFFL